MGKIYIYIREEHLTSSEPRVVWFTLSRLCLRNSCTVQLLIISKKLRHRCCSQTWLPRKISCILHHSHKYKPSIKRLMHFILPIGSDIFHFVKLLLGDMKSSDITVKDKIFSYDSVYIGCLSIIEKQVVHVSEEM